MRRILYLSRANNSKDAEKKKTHMQVEMQDDKRKRKKKSQKIGWVYVPAAVQLFVSATNRRSLHVAEPYYNTDCCYFFFLYSLILTIFSFLLSFVSIIFFLFFFFISCLFFRLSFHDFVFLLFIECTLCILNAIQYMMVLLLYLVSHFLVYLFILLWFNAYTRHCTHTYQDIRQETCESLLSAYSRCLLFSHSDCHMVFSLTRWAHFFVGVLDSLRY